MRIVAFLCLWSATALWHQRCLCVASQRKKREEPAGKKDEDILYKQLDNYAEFQKAMVEYRALEMRQVATAYVNLGRTCQDVDLHLADFVTGDAVLKGLEPLRKEILEAASEFYDRHPHQPGTYGTDISAWYAEHGMSKDDFIKLHDRHFEEGRTRLATQVADEIEYYIRMLETETEQNANVAEEEQFKTKRTKRAVWALALVQAAPYILPAVGTIAKFVMMIVGVKFGLDWVGTAFGLDDSSAKTKEMDAKVMYRHVATAMESGATHAVYLMNVKTVTKDITNMQFKRFSSVMDGVFFHHKASRYFFSDDDDIRGRLKMLLGDYYEGSPYARNPQKAVPVMEVHPVSYDMNTAIVRTQVCMPTIDPTAPVKPIFMIEPMGYLEGDYYIRPNLPQFVLLPSLYESRSLTLNDILMEAQQVDWKSCVFMGSSAVCPEFEKMELHCNLYDDTGCFRSKELLGDRVLSRRLGQTVIVAQNFCNMSIVKMRNDPRSERNKMTNERIFSVELGEDEELHICHKTIVGAGVTSTHINFTVGRYDKDFAKKQLMDTLTVQRQYSAPFFDKIFEDIKGINDTFDTGTKWGIGGTTAAALLLAGYYFLRKDHIKDDLASVVKASKATWDTVSHLVDFSKHERKKLTDLSRKKVGIGGDHTRLKDLDTGHTDYNTEAPSPPIEDYHPDLATRRPTSVKRRMKKSAIKTSRRIMDHVERGYYSSVAPFVTDVEQKIRDEMTNIFSSIKTKASTQKPMLSSIMNAIFGGGRGAQAAASLATSFLPTSLSLSTSAGHENRNPTTGFYPQAVPFNEQVVVNPLTGAARYERQFQNQVAARQKRGGRRVDDSSDEDIEIGRACANPTRSQADSVQFNNEAMLLHYDVDENEQKVTEGRPHSRMLRGTPVPPNTVFTAQNDTKKEQ